MATTPVFLSGESHGHRSLAGYSPWGRMDWDRSEQHSTLSHETGWGFRGALKSVGTHRVGTGLIRVCREAWSSVLKTWLVSPIVGTKYHGLGGLK